MKQISLEGLRKWFGVHFGVDMAAAVPLFLWPRQVLGWLGIETGNVVLARIIAAALLGIGLESWWGKGGTREQFVGMLRLKIVWSGAAMAGLVLGLVERDLRFGVGIVVFGLFLGFNLVWVYWYRRLAVYK